ncbi:MAG: hypothetical protein R3B82_21940 [Sandaracinaceae bacterium]
MYRDATPPSDPFPLAAASAARWAHRMRALVLGGSVAVGVGAGLFALDQLQMWAHVFVLAYGTLGLGAGFGLYYVVGRPLVRLALRRQLSRLAARHGVSTEDLAWTHAWVV